jgi:hypothetical protein
MRSYGKSFGFLKHTSNMLFWNPTGRVRTSNVQGAALGVALSVSLGSGYRY